METLAEQLSQQLLAFTAESARNGITFANVIARKQTEDVLGISTVGEAIGGAALLKTGQENISPSTKSQNEANAA